MAYANGYTYRRTITIDHTKVSGSADLTNYPCLVKGTYTYLKTVANSGKVQSATGYDIIFTSDADGANVLDFERVAWSATTGEVVFHVEVPTVDYDANTVFYMFYGNSSVSTDQQDIEGTWHSGYKCVIHTTTDPSSIVLDSTSNNQDLTCTNMGSSNVVDGKIGKAFDFNGSDEYGSFGAFSVIEGQSKVVMSFWADVDTFGNLEGFFDKESGANNRFAVTQVVISGTADDTFIPIGNGANSFGYTNGLHVYNTNPQLHQIIYDGSQAAANRLKYYLNGSQVTLTISGTIPTTTSTDSANAVIGRYLTNYLDGRMEEFRLATGDSIPTADWLVTEYNNQNDPSTFYEIGDETELSAGSPSSSESPSQSPSSSESPSQSPSSSNSPSQSPSSSESPSQSPSSSQSPSESSSESPSQSPSSSESPSQSPSSSPSIPPKIDYSKGDYLIVPTNDNDLENIFTLEEVNNVETENEVYVRQSASNETALFLFKNQNDNNTDGITLQWKGKTDISPTESIVNLQIFNRTSGEWETVDSDNTTEANTVFTLTAEIITNLNNYYDDNYWIASRVSQEAI